MQDKEELEGQYALVKELFSDVKKYRRTEEFRDLLNFMKRFDHLSAFNALLVHCQNPGSQFVATPSQWNEYKRRVKPGARPMVILWPFGPVRFVYDLKDTEGDETFPRELLEPFNVEGHIEQHFYDLMIGGLRSYRIRYVERDMGSAGAAYISAIKEKDYIYNKNNEKIDIYYHLVVSADLPVESKFAAVTHELGHLLCGHLGSDKTGKQLFRDRRDVGVEEAEFEAETVSYIVCRRLGIKPRSEKYLAGYLYKKDGIPEIIPEIRLDLVIKAVGLIEVLIKSLIDKHKKLRKKETLRLMRLMSRS